MLPLVTTTLIICLLISKALCQESCPGSPQPLISGDQYRVEDYQFSASSSFSSSYLPPEARLGGNSWCSRDGLPPDSNHWIQIDFGADVVIHELQTGGDGGFYLTQFRIEIGPDSTQLSSVLQPNSTQVMIFTRPDTSDVWATVLSAPITARVLRIVRVSHVGEEVCVDIEALGCLLSPGCVAVELLSTNRSLLPLLSIMASSAMSDDPAQDVVDSGNLAWCTAEQFNAVEPTPYIVFNFTERVMLTHMRARGGVGGLSYVTEFSLDYRDQYTDSYTLYTLLSTEEAVFSTSSSGRQTHTFWRQPLEGKVFRFKIRDGVRNRFLNQNDFCWNVQLFGCLPSEQGDIATTFSSPLDTTQLLSTAGFTVAMTTTTTPIQTNTDRIGASTGAIVGGVVGGVIAILAILLLIVLLLVCVLKNKTRTLRLTESENAYSKPVRVVDNEIYGQETPPASPTDEKQLPKGTDNINSTVDTYESIGSPNVNPSTYEAVEYSYAKVDTAIKVVLPEKTEAAAITEQSDQFGMQTDGNVLEERMVVNTAYGSLEGNKAQLETINQKEIIENPLYGAMTVDPM